MRIKKMIDISREIHSDMVVWPGDKGVHITQDLSIENGDVCNLSSVEMGLHTGTHVDAPLHFIPNGTDIMSLDLQLFMGTARVVELTVKEKISLESIENLSLNKDEIVLFKTDNTQISEGECFQSNFIYLDTSAAGYLIEKGIKAVGVDYLSVDGSNGGHQVHTMLLSKGIGIIEGLNLKNVEEGRYFLCCLPLKIRGVDGSPVRAVLIEFEI